MMRQLAVWRDPAGRFSALKLVVLLVLLWPGVDLALGYATGMLGARPMPLLPAPVTRAILPVKVIGGKASKGFFLEKEAKTFYPLASPSPRRLRSQWIKVFWFFFSKKNCLPWNGITP